MPDNNQSLFVYGVVRIGKSDREVILEYGDGFQKRNAMLGYVCFCFVIIPIKIERGYRPFARRRKPMLAA